MGFMDKLLGNAAEIDPKEVEGIVGPLIIEGESVSHSFMVGVRDMMIFTNYRLIFVDKTGLFLGNFRCLSIVETNPR